ncbi:hypothetical protein UPYG_G00263520 [Umbra pygmaea]|uniref:Uncharacterized protein n=1 Tax=Umbra pygmaea TaxID=75934 RepID=A0ABD0WZR9_UMBPY
MNGPINEKNSKLSPLYAKTLLAANKREELKFKMEKNAIVREERHRMRTLHGGSNMNCGCAFLNKLVSGPPRTLFHTSSPISNKGMPATEVPEHSPTAKHLGNQW